jgi:hypothetical protein
VRGQRERFVGREGDQHDDQERREHERNDERVENQRDRAVFSHDDLTQ